MTSKYTIVVVGATGAQGGGLVRAILEDGQFIARAITRNPDSDAAKELAAAGAEVVKADINVEDSIKEACKDCYGMFCVTLSDDENYTPEIEMKQAQNMANAAKLVNDFSLILDLNNNCYIYPYCRSCSLKHVIWSTMEDTRLLVPQDSIDIPTLNGKYKVPHFDIKGECDNFFADLPTTFLLPSFYWENFIEMQMGPTKYLGKVYFSLPIADKRLAGISCTDIGRCALGIFKNPQHYIGKRIGISGDCLSLVQMAQIMSKVFDVKVIAHDMPVFQYRKLGFEGADDFANMFQFMQEFEPEFCGARIPDNARKLNRQMLTFEKWLEINKDKIPIK